MDHAGGIVDLQRLGLSSGEARRLDLALKLQEIELGGQSYAPEGEKVEARLDVSRTTTGFALRLHLDTVLDGPCVRCLTPSRFPLSIDVREVDQPSTDDEELRSPYVADGVLDAARWAQDAVVFALPAQPLCREDCAGLCDVCGEPLNDAPEGAHDHPRGGDPRMAKLRDLKLDT